MVPEDRVGAGPVPGTACLNISLKAHRGSWLPGLGPAQDPCRLELPGALQRRAHIQPGTSLQGPRGDARHWPLPPGSQRERGLGPLLQVAETEAWAFLSRH